MAKAARRNWITTILQGFASLEIAPPSSRRTFRVHSERLQDSLASDWQAVGEDLWASLAHTTREVNGEERETHPRESRAD